MAIAESLVWEYESPDLDSLSIRGLRLATEQVEPDGEPAQVINLHPEFRGTAQGDYYPADEKSQEKAASDELPLGTAQIPAWRALMEQAGKSELLTHSEEISLAKKIKSGDPQAKKEMIFANLGLVASIAKLYAHKHEMNDLIQAGCEGLIAATEKFDPDLGNRFSTFASKLIRNAIIKCVCDETRTVRLPAHMHQKRKVVRKQETIFTNSNERIPTQKDNGAIAAASRLHTFQVENLIKAFNDPVSLESPIGRGQHQISDLTLQDTIPTGDEWTNPESRLQKGIAKSWLKLLIKELDETERFLVGGSFGFHGEEKITLKELGVQLGISPAMASSALASALQKMHDKADKAGVSFDMLMSGK